MSQLFHGEPKSHSRDKPQPSQPHVTVQVLPYSVRLHDLLGGLCTLLRGPDGRTTVWLESSKSGELFEDPTRPATSDT